MKARNTLTHSVFLVGIFVLTIVAGSAFAQQDIGYIAAPTFDVSKLVTDAAIARIAQPVASPFVVATSKTTFTDQIAQEKTPLTAIGTNNEATLNNGSSLTWQHQWNALTAAGMQKTNYNDAYVKTWKNAAPTLTRADTIWTATARALINTSPTITNVATNRPDDYSIAAGTWSPIGHQSPTAVAALQKTAVLRAPSQTALHLL